MRAKKYIQMPDDGFVPLRKAFKTACCDCGLVHSWNLQEDGYDNFVFRVKRDNRATAQLRRRKRSMRVRDDTETTQSEVAS